MKNGKYNGENGEGDFDMSIGWVFAFVSKPLVPVCRGFQNHHQRRLPILVFERKKNAELQSVPVPVI